MPQSLTMIDQELIPLLEFRCCISSAEESRNGMRYCASDVTTGMMYEVRYLSITHPTTPTPTSSSPQPQQPHQQRATVEPTAADASPQHSRRSPHTTWPSGRRPTRAQVERRISELLMQPPPGGWPPCIAMPVDVYTHTKRLDGPRTSSAPSAEAEVEDFIVSVSPFCGVSLGDMLRSGWKIVEEQTFRDILDCVEQYGRALRVLPRHGNLTADAVMELMTVRDVQVESGRNGGTPQHRWCVADWGLLSCETPSLALPSPRSDRRHSAGKSPRGKRSSGATMGLTDAEELAVRDLEWLLHSAFHKLTVRTADGCRFLTRTEVEEAIGTTVARIRDSLSGASSAVPDGSKLAEASRLPQPCLTPRDQQRVHQWLDTTAPLTSTACDDSPIVPGTAENGAGECVNATETQVFNPSNKSARQLVDYQQDMLRLEEERLAGLRRAREQENRPLAQRNATSESLQRVTDWLQVQRNLRPPKGEMQAKLSRRRASTGGLLRADERLVSFTRGLVQRARQEELDQQESVAAARRAKREVLRRTLSTAAFPIRGAAPPAKDRDAVGTLAAEALTAAESQRESLLTDLANTMPTKQERQAPVTCATPPQQRPKAMTRLWGAGPESEREGSPEPRDPRTPSMPVPQLLMAAIHPVEELPQTQQPLSARDETILKRRHVFSGGKNGFQAAGLAQTTPQPTPRGVQPPTPQIHHQRPQGTPKATTKAAAAPHVTSPHRQLLSPRRAVAPTSQPADQLGLTRSRTANCIFSPTRNIEPREAIQRPLRWETQPRKRTELQRTASAATPLLGSKTTAEGRRRVSATSPHSPRRPREVHTTSGLLLSDPVSTPRNRPHTRQLGEPVAPTPRGAARRTPSRRAALSPTPRRQVLADSGSKPGRAPLATRKAVDANALDLSLSTLKQTSSVSTLGGSAQKLRGSRVEDESLRTQEKVTGPERDVGCSGSPQSSRGERQRNGRRPGGFARGAVKPVSETSPAISTRRRFAGLHTED